MRETIVHIIVYDINNSIISPMEDQLVKMIKNDYMIEIKKICFDPSSKDNIHKSNIH